MLARPSFALIVSVLLLLAPSVARAGPFGGPDLASAQRGYAVYAQVCSACHSMRQLTYADLGGVGLDHAQIRALAAARKVTDGVGAVGRPARRPGRPDDHLPAPFASPQAAALANNGALPPDMSRLALTRPGGAPAIAALLTGYRPAPPGFSVPPGSYYNPAEPGGLIAMPPPLSDDAVEFADHTRATVPRMATDVAAFLDWAAHPHRAARTRIGVGVVLYLSLLAMLAFLLKRRIWSNVHRNH
jgi:ubiquinol-cytochrome c reductase cytochrome c1 subunit